MFREVSRKNKRILLEESINILKTAKRGVLSVNGDDGYPYGVPLNHYYSDEDGCLYFHGGNTGYRIEAVNNDSRVSYCVIDEGRQRENDWALEFRSVVVFGKAEFIKDEETIIDVVTRLSHNFTSDDNYIEKEIKASLYRTTLIRLTPEHITGKKIIEK